MKDLFPSGALIIDRGGAKPFSRGILVGGARIDALGMFDPPTGRKDCERYCDPGRPDAPPPYSHCPTKFWLLFTAWIMAALSASTPFEENCSSGPCPLGFRVGVETRSGRTVPPA
jgi:hypothetical protein